MQAIQSVTEKFSNMFGSSVPKTGSDTDEAPTQQLEIIREEVVLPKCFESKLAFVLHNVLTKKVPFFIHVVQKSIYIKILKCVQQTYTEMEMYIFIYC